jgi:hypothetical protein
LAAIEKLFSPIETVIDAIATAAEKLRDLLEDIWDWWQKILGLGDIPGTQAQAQSSGNNLGQWLSSGIAQGIYDGSHWVAQAAVWTVYNAMAAAQRAAGVHSPSALFASLGSDLMAGLQAGMAAQMPAISAVLGAAGNTSIIQNFNVGGNTINSGTDEAIFEARVVSVIRRNMSGAGGGVL